MVMLMTEMVMTLAELMIEHTPPRIVGSTHERRSMSWSGWLVPRFDWLSGHEDWNRKI